MKFDRIQRFAPQIRTIAQKYGISKISVFGSTARGDVTDQSDVDFLVEMQEGASLFGIGGFGYEAEKLLGVQVDVVPLSVLPHISDREFVDRIQKDAIVI